MVLRSRNRFTTFVAAAICMFVFGTMVSAGQSDKKEHAFKGKVEKVDAKARTVTVNGENVEGWMAAMTMTYAVDKEETLKQLKNGDEISAKVYDGDFKTLHDVKVVTAKK